MIGVLNFDLRFGRMSREIRDSLGSDALTVSMIQAPERDDSYPAFFIAVQRPSRAPREFSTHMLVVPDVTDEPASVHLCDGHYDMLTYEEAFDDLLARAGRYRL